MVPILRNIRYLENEGLCHVIRVFSSGTENLINLIFNQKWASYAWLTFTISASRQPFIVQFQSDAFTYSHAMVARKGFQLQYWQARDC